MAKKQGKVTVNTGRGYSRGNIAERIKSLTAGHVSIGMAYCPLLPKAIVDSIRATGVVVHSINTGKRRIYFAPVWVAILLEETTLNRSSKKLIKSATVSFRKLLVTYVSSVPMQECLVSDYLLSGATDYKEACQAWLCQEDARNGP